MLTVVLIDTKYPHNLAAAIRAAACFGVGQVLWTGSRLSFAEGERLPREERMKGYRYVQVLHDDRPFDAIRRYDEKNGTQTVPICVELTPSAQSLNLFHHPPADAAYVFGPEDGHVPQAVRTLCHSFVFIPAHHCLNLAASVNVVLAHRLMHRQSLGLEGHVHPAETEQRGLIEVPGWEGK
jgi:tRNA(Leu) C34 or U34 (ribose-2'-O)-methylase TrmL